MRATCLALLFALPALALASPTETVPRPTAGAFVVTTTPTKDGVRATCDLPASQHKRNVGGSDGYGLCVYTSFWHSAIWQSASSVYGFRDWMRGYPGGSFPEKFASTLNDYCREKGIPVPEYLQHTGGDEDVLRLALKTGRAVCVTYCGVDGPGRYSFEVVGHMVNLVHLDDDRAAILDNNFPGTWLWMSRADFLARWRGVQANGLAFLGKDRWGRRFPIGGGWAIILLGPPPAPYPSAPPVEFAAAGGCVCGGGCKCEPGKCPGGCPLAAEPVLIGQCKGGQCLLNEKPAAVPFGTPPSSEYEWGQCINGLMGWKLKDKPAAEVGAQAAPVGQFPSGGVDSAALTRAPEARYMCRGVACTKAEFAASILGDDSGRWNLSIVGEPNFAAKVRADADALPKSLRDKLHVQSYAPGEWSVSQFRLGAGVTLRAPAVNRVAADVGTVAVADYTAAALLDLMGRPKGPDPKPVAPAPKPADPVIVPQPMPPGPAVPGLLWLVVGGVVLYLLVRR